MKVAFASDDSNECVEAVKKYLVDNCDVVFPTNSDMWPDLSRSVADVVASGECQYGVLMCWTGTGTAMAANKVKGARAAAATEAWTARNARRWNDANILALSLKRLAPDVAVECVEAFIQTDDIDPDEAETISLTADF